MEEEREGGGRDKVGLISVVIVFWARHCEAGRYSYNCDRFGKERVKEVTKHCGIGGG
jgi:hypothetical protein